MHGVDGNRPVNFDRNSHFDFETGCGGSKVGGGANGNHDFFVGATRKASPFDEVSGNLPIPSSFLQKPDSGSGMAPELRDVLRKLINRLSDAKKGDSTEGTSATGDASGNSIEGESGKQLLAAILMLLILQLQDKNSAGNDMNGGGPKLNDLAEAIEKHANASDMDPDILSLLKDILATLSSEGNKSGASGRGDEAGSLIDGLFDNNPATANMDPSLVAILKELLTVLLGGRSDGEMADPVTPRESDNLLDPSKMQDASDLRSLLAELVSLLFGTGHEAPSDKKANTNTGPAPRETKSVSLETPPTTKVDPSSDSPTKTVETKTEKTDLPKEGEVIVVSEPIVVDGGVFDGKGATYTASTSLGDGSQSEGQAPIFILENGATLKNVDIGENGADGIHVYNGATVENVNWLDVGEDALTVKSPGDLTIIGGSAKGASDKIFQVNADAKIFIKDFDADGFTSFVRTNGGKQLDVDVVIDGGSFANGANLFRTDSSLASVTFQSEITLSNVKNWTRVGDQQSGA
jgi:hypothetical protein